MMKTCRLPAHKKSTGDVEAGTTPDPVILESTELRWAFIRKIYVIITLQLLLTIAVVSVFVFVRPIKHFVASSIQHHLSLSLAVVGFLFIVPFIVLWPLHYYYNRHPINLVMLSVCTISISLTVGLACALTSGKVILESAILTAVVAISLTLYTFWAARRGHDFKFLGPFLFASILVLIVFGFIQILFPLGKLSVMIYGGLGAIIFSGCIIYDTDNLIKRYSYDEYVWAAVALYVDIINLFLALVNIISGGGDS